VVVEGAQNAVALVVDGESPRGAQHGKEGGMSNEEKSVRVRVGGHPEGDLISDDLFSATGGVPDGVALRFEANTASFIVDFGDLEKLYLAAKAYRQEHQQEIAEAKERWRKYGVQ
jgi:hypothetical protein